MSTDTSGFVALIVAGFLPLPRALGRVPGRWDASPQVVPERNDRRGGDEHVVARDPDADERGAKKPQLQAKRDGVERPLPEKRDVRAERDQVQHAAGVAQVTVR